MNLVRPLALVGGLKLKTMIAAAAMVAMAGTAQAALVDRGGGMIYDSTRNITWLVDMDYAVTSGYAAANVGGTGSTQILAGGGMGWDAANNWANNLVYGGFSYWRLPTLNPLDATCSDRESPSGLSYGFNCIGGALSGLFVTDLGNKAVESDLRLVGDTDEQKSNLALFSNVAAVLYWSGTAYAPNPAGAWAFNGVGGSQGAPGTYNAFNALAVRAGDGSASVPEPQTLALLGLAGVALGW